MPTLWIADQVRNDGAGWIVCLTLWFPAYAGMTVRDASVTGCVVSPSPLIPLPSRERGIRWFVWWLVFRRRGGDGYCLLRVSVAKSAYARRCVCLGVRVVLVVCFCSFSEQVYLLNQLMVLCLRRRIPRFLDRSARFRLYPVCRIG